MRIRTSVLTTLLLTAVATAGPVTMPAATLPAATAPATTRATTRATARPYAIRPDEPTGVYALNQPVTWSIEWTGTGAPPSAKYAVLAGQVKAIGEGAIEWQGTHASVHTALAEPGTALLKVTFDGVGTPGLGGVVVAPEQIGLAAPKPDDFDAFWQSKLEELAAVPVDARLAPGDAHKPNVDYFQITMNNIRGTHIRGQLARPHAGERFPALLIVQWAGVYGLQQSWVTNPASDGWLVLNINPHDLPIDQPPEFYKRQAAGPLKDYAAIGNEDRETSYFLRMYLSCYRAADYLAHRPDWDGKTLVVMGGSQGGLQSLLTAALYPEKVTAALADVPAGCDTLGPAVGRRDGWPQWYSSTWGGRDAAKVHEASRYYDIANFAPRIRCPVVIGAGLIDQTCPAAGIFAATNQIPSPKEVLLFPYGEHHDENKSHGRWTQAVYSKWLPNLMKGVVPPLND